MNLNSPKCDGGINNNLYDHDTIQEDVMVLPGTEFHLPKFVNIGGIV